MSVADVVELFRRATDEFDRRVRAVTEDQWTDGTPCTEWDVRTLVNHLVNEDKWVTPLLEGKTIEDVGDSLDGDLLGDDPVGAWEQAKREAVAATQQEGVAERTVHVSFGDISGDDYLSQVATDHVVHAWDLARAIGVDERLDPELVQFAYDVLEPQAEAWRSAGVFKDEVEVPEGADRQAQLLAITGRSL
jgi:uncharacterized protein (TIGR03086 family)